jgi:hypothetical protein
MDTMATNEGGIKKEPRRGVHMGFKEEEKANKCASSI